MNKVLIVDDHLVVREGLKLLIGMYVFFISLSTTMRKNVIKQCVERRLSCQKCYIH